MARIAVLSTAHIHTNGFLEQIEKAADGRALHGIWDDAADRGRRYAEKFKVPFVDRIEQLISDPAVDGFLICAENTRHRPLLEKVIPIGKPVFCEKPLCTTAEDADAILRLLDGLPTVLFCGYFMPFGREFRAVARELEAGSLGQVTHARLVNAHHAAYGRWFDNPDLAWFHQPDLSGGGALMDMGTHAVHALCSFFGPAGAVWAEIANKSGEYPNADDFGVMHIRFKNGVFGTVEASWVQTGGIGGLQITGRQRTIWNTPQGYVMGGPDHPAAPLEMADTRPGGVERLVAAIRGQIDAGELAADREAVFEAVRVMAAAYRSSGEGGKWVALA